MNSNHSNIIRRMIDSGYTNQDIVVRLRCTEEAVEAVRELIQMEHEAAKKHSEQHSEHNDEDWGNE